MTRYMAVIARNHDDPGYQYARPFTNCVAVLVPEDIVESVAPLQEMMRGLNLEVDGYLRLSLGSVKVVENVTSVFGMLSAPDGDQPAAIELGDSVIRDLGPNEDDYELCAWISTDGRVARLFAKDVDANEYDLPSWFVESMSR